MSSASVATRSRARSRAGLHLGPTGLLLVVPLVMLELAVLFAPLVYLVVQSLRDWRPGAASPFVGAQHYVTLFADANFWEVVGNQLFYLLGVPLWVAAPLLIAYLLREHVRWPGFFRSVYFLPAVMAPAVVALVFRSLLSVDGPVNATLESLGLGSLALPWLTNAGLVKPVIILLILWTGFGTGVLIFSSALSAVPQSIFEAGRLDGVGFWGELWHLAIPSIRPTIVLWMIYQVISIFLFMYSWIAVLTGGGPGLASATMDFAIYQQFMRFGQFGAAAAHAVVLVVCILIVATLGWIATRIVGRLTERRA